MRSVTPPTPRQHVSTVGRGKENPPGNLLLSPPQTLHPHLLQQPSIHASSQVLPSPPVVFLTFPSYLFISSAWDPNLLQNMFSSTVGVGRYWRPPPASFPHEQPVGVGLLVHRAPAQREVNFHMMPIVIFPRYCNFYFYFRTQQALWDGALLLFGIGDKDDKNKPGIVVSSFHPRWDSEIWGREKDIIMMFKKSCLWPSTPSATCVLQP